MATSGKVPPQFLPGYKPKPKPGKATPKPKPKKK